MGFWFSEGHGGTYLVGVCVTTACVQEKVAHRKLDSKSERTWHVLSLTRIVVMVHTCTVCTLATGSSDVAPPTPHPQTQPWNTCCGHWLICELYCREDLLMWATKWHEDPFSEIAKYHR